MPIRKIAAALLALAVMSSGAMAQRKTDEQKKAEAELRKQEDMRYRSSTENIQTKDVLIDPWSNMRGDGDTAASKKKK